MGFSIPGSGLVKSAVHGASRLAQGAAHGVEHAGEAVAHATEDVVSVAGHVADPALEAGKWLGKQGKNFAGGVVEWGKSTVGTVVGLASHPVATAKALGHLAMNPVLNPVGGTINAALHGKNPLEAYKQGAGELKNIGSQFVSDYKNVYKEHGVAGAAGFVAPDIVTAILSGGTTEAAKVGGTVAAKGLVKEVASETAEAAASSTTRSVAKDVGKEFVPGPEDVADNNRKAEYGQQNHLEALIGNFSF